jgi:predicted phosphoribosyltransferase
VLVERAEDHNARELFTMLVATYKENKLHPFRQKRVLVPTVDAIVATGVESLAELAALRPEEAPGIKPKDLKRLQNDFRVLRFIRKMEL